MRVADEWPFPVAVESAEASCPFGFGLQHVTCHLLPPVGNQKHSLTMSTGWFFLLATLLLSSEPLHGFSILQRQQQSARIHSSPTTDSSRLYSDQVMLDAPTARIARVAAGVVVPQQEQQPYQLSPWEIWCMIGLERWYRKALQLKCPFMRRRASDVLDAVDMVLRFLVIRHKSLDLLSPPGWRCQGETCNKVRGLSRVQLVEVIRKDWRTDTNKGYYITGRLNTTIYRDDCLFDGPDPDMPVRGLRKYLNAASQLFDQGKSRAQLLSLDIVGNVVVAKWRMNGILRLPWKPKLPNWTGSTIYHFDADGLVYRHEETWDMSVAQAFLRTLWPQLAEQIWKDNAEEDDEEVCSVI